MEHYAASPLAVTHLWRAAAVATPCGTGAGVGVSGKRCLMPLRQRPLDVGLLLDYAELGDGVRSGEGDYTPIVMHSQVSTACFRACVQRQATAAQLAAAYGVPEPLVAGVWLGGERPRPRPLVESIPPARTHLARASAAAGGAGADEAVRTFAHTLAGKLEALAAVQGAERPAGEHCGFGAAHGHIRVLCGGSAIAKTHAGLYKTARGARGVRPSPTAPFYFEVAVVSDEHAGGICVGVGTARTPLGKLVGNARAVGLHSSGQLVRRGEQFESYGAPFAAGDRIGVLTAAHDDGLAITFFVNGQRQPTVHETLDGDGDDDEEQLLYPVVSLYRHRSRVLLRCCEADWSTQRSALGEVCAVCQR